MYRTVSYRRILYGIVTNKKLKSLLYPLQTFLIFTRVSFFARSNHHLDIQDLQQVADEEEMQSL